MKSNGESKVERQVFEIKLEFEEILRSNEILSVISVVAKFLIISI
jgi:hypothetical protein